jgi:predicted ATP-binding protein involved in virulence
VTAESLKLTSASVENVLGEYNHRVDFPERDDFLIIYGPNGVGKTKFLEIIHAASKLDGRALFMLPFSNATLQYSDGSAIHVTRPHPNSFNFREENSYRYSEPSVYFEVVQRDRTVLEWEFTGDEFDEWVVENTTWRSIGYDVWVSEQRRVPQPLREFAEKVPAFLIETQRLKVEQLPLRRPVAWNASVRDAPSSTISGHAAKMRELVNEAQTEHSTITQQLDRTFPNRVLESPANVSMHDEDVRERYNEQNSFRSRLGTVVSVALDDALSLPERDLSRWELNLLNLYLDDADKKLAPFELLLQKIELLENIINSRLLKKRLQVTARKGLSVVHASEEHDIDLNSLSSGEQHEIILMFDLLFNVPAGALVLIDEPEISLHVVWQLAFIPDVQRIAELAGFRFVVATHSPQIINDAWDRAVRLGPPEVAFL